MLCAVCVPRGAGTRRPDPWFSFRSRRRIIRLLANSRCVEPHGSRCGVGAPDQSIDNLLPSIARPSCYRPGAVLSMNSYVFGVLAIAGLAHNPTVAGVSIAHARFL